jgi:hypothetical protein
MTTSVSIPFMSLVQVQNESPPNSEVTSQGRRAGFGAGRRYFAYGKLLLASSMGEVSSLTKCLYYKLFLAVIDVITELALVEFRRKVACQ